MLRFNFNWIHKVDILLFYHITVFWSTLTKQNKKQRQKCSCLKFNLKTVLLGWLSSNFHWFLNRHVTLKRNKLVTDADVCVVEEAGWVISNANEKPVSELVPGSHISSSWSSPASVAFHFGVVVFAVQIWTKIFNWNRTHRPFFRWFSRTVLSLWFFFFCSILTLHRSLCGTCCCFQLVWLDLSRLHFLPSSDSWWSHGYSGDSGTLGPFRTHIYSLNILVEVHWC